MSDHDPLEPLLDVEEVVPILNKIAVFGGLNDRQLADIFKLLQKTKYAKGSFVFEKGDSPSHIYIVLSGRVELLLEAGGKFLAKNIFEKGDCFGETAVIGIQKHTASAVALEETKLIVLPRKALFNIWETDKELFGMLVLNIAREACRRLNQADETLLHYFAEHIE
ncbi:MAG: cyclic nucleotide-binding domain-containing protein [Planctomycetota bacterium]|jgi:CRP-like cAMP-binding protein